MLLFFSVGQRIGLGLFGDDRQGAVPTGCSLRGSDGFKQRSREYINKCIHTYTYTYISYIHIQVYYRDSLFFNSRNV